MSSRRRLERAALGACLALALAGAASCYRAEIDLTPLFDDPPSAGGSASGGAASSDSGASDAGANAAGAACDATPDDPLQYQCRLREPSKQVCDEQDLDGWSGCYFDGCHVCVEALADYPYYLARHPCCPPNPVCSVHAPIKCSPLCPPPTALDQRPPCVNLAR